MDKSSESQDSLIERYVTGSMSKAETLEFEAFILSKPDWLKKVNRARSLFEDIYEQEMKDELEATLKQQKSEVLATRNNQFSWLYRLLVPAGTMVLGACLTFALMPTQTIQPLGMIHTDVIDTTRKLGEPEKTILLFVEKETDQIALKLPTTNDLSKRFTVQVDTGSDHFARKGYVPDAYGNVVFSLARDFKHDELITVSLVDQANGKVFREYRLVIKEN